MLGYFLFLWMRESLLISYCFLRDRNPTCIYIGHFVFSFDTEKRRIFSSSLHYVTLCIRSYNKPFQVKSYTDIVRARSAAPFDELATKTIISFSTSKCKSVMVSCFLFMI